MISELAGYTLARTIPSEFLYGVVTGAYKVCGGVIRNHSGQIVAHLVNAGTSLSNLTPVSAALSSAVDAINTVQLYKIGKDVKALQVATEQVINLAQGTMALSGLTLAVSSAGFIFLAKKLNQIDQRLSEISKDVKAIKDFLQSQEKAALAAALKTLSGIQPNLDDKTRIPLLIGVRQTLGEIHQRYRDQLLNVDRIEHVFAIEEYYTVTALGHAMCSAELDMSGNAIADIDDAYNTWHISARRICNELSLGDVPERLLCSAYGSTVRTDEIIDWMDFAHGADKGIEWIDELRKNLSSFRMPQIRLSGADVKGIEIMRKLVARDRIYQGFSLQYRYLDSAKLRPSAMQQYIDSLDPTEKCGDSFLFVSNDALPPKLS